MSVNNFQTCIHFLAMKLILSKAHIKEPKKCGFLLTYWNESTFLGNTVL